MAYAYEGIATTQSGKIIYRRKSHAFSGRDLKRIIKSIGFPDDAGRYYDWLLAALELLELIRDVNQTDVREGAASLALSLRTFIATNDAFTEFGGGEFGGGGATGIFGLPLRT